MELEARKIQTIVPLAMLILPMLPPILIMAIVGLFLAINYLPKAA